MKGRLPQLGVLVVAVAFLGYWALLVYCDIWRSSPLGMRLRASADRVLVDAVTSGGPAQRAGLRAGDRIASSDGHPIGGRLDWMTVEANFEIGRTIQLSVDRSGTVVSPAFPPGLTSCKPWQSQNV